MTIATKNVPLEGKTDNTETSIATRNRLKLQKGFGSKVQTIIRTSDDPLSTNPGIDTIDALVYREQSVGEYGETS